MLRQICLLVTLTLSSLTVLAVQTETGQTHFNSGQFEQAAKIWSTEWSDPALKNQPQRYIDTSLRLSVAYLRLGLLKDACNVLESALPLAEKEPTHHASVLMHLSDVYFAMRDFQSRELMELKNDCQAINFSNLENDKNQNIKEEVLKKTEKKLNEAAQKSFALNLQGFENLEGFCRDKTLLEKYTATKKPLLLAKLLTRQGNVFIAQGEYAKALECYQNSMESSDKVDAVDAQVLSAKTAINIISAYVKNGNKEEAKVAFDDAWQRVNNLQDSHDKAFSLISLVQFLPYLQSTSTPKQQQFTLPPLSREQIQPAHTILNEAIQVAKHQKDNRSLAYANGYMAQIYAQTAQIYAQEYAQKQEERYREQEKRHREDAIHLTQQALLYAQSYPIISKNPDEITSHAETFISKRSKFYLPSPQDKDSKECEEKCQTGASLPIECQGTCRNIPPLFLQNYYPELLFRLQRQLGVLGEVQAQPQLAIDAYNMAADYLQHVRQGYRCGSSQLGEDAEEFFREMIKYLLKIAAEKKNGSKEEQNLLKMAVKTIEILKETELQNYFQDVCVTKEWKETFPVEVSDLTQGIDLPPEKTAFFYPVIFEKDDSKVRIVLVVVFQDGNIIMQQVSESINVKDLENDIKDFLEKITSTNARHERVRVKASSGKNQQPKNSECSKEGESVVYSYKEKSKKMNLKYDYCPHANKLYKWLIKPINSDLKKRNVNTLVIISPESLFNIPFAALHDGNNFLIESYALARVPGIKLTDRSSKIVPEKISALLSGLFDCHDDNEYCKDPSGKSVPLKKEAKAELEDVEKILKKINDNVYLLPEYLFLTDKVKSLLSDTYYSIVHFTTHGKFEQNPNKSHLVTYDGILTLTSLADIFEKIRKKWAPNTIELLTLSACESAKGGERGMAGVAVKTGVRGAFATLWLVSDELTGPLVTDFYKNLFEKDNSLSKAQALQQAQIALIRNSIESETEKYQEDPYYWAAFVLIGNWL